MKVNAICNIVSLGGSLMVLRHFTRSDDIIFYRDAAGSVRVCKFFRSHNAVAYVLIDGESISILRLLKMSTVLDEVSLREGLAVLDKSRIFEGLDIARLDRIKIDGYDKNIQNMGLMANLSMDEVKDLFLALVESKGFIPDDYSFIAIRLRYNDFNLLCGLSERLGIGSVGYDLTGGKSSISNAAIFLVTKESEVKWCLELFSTRKFLGLGRDNTIPYIVDKFDIGLLTEYRIIGLIIGHGTFPAFKRTRITSETYIGLVKFSFMMNITNRGFSVERIDRIELILRSMQKILCGGGSASLSTTKDFIKLHVRANGSIRCLRLYLENRLLGVKAEEFDCYSKLYCPSTSNLLKLSSREKALVLNSIGMVRKDFLSNDELHEDHMKCLAEALYLGRLDIDSYSTSAKKFFVYYHLLMQGKIKL